MNTLLFYAFLFSAVAAEAQIKEVTVKEVHNAGRLTVFSNEYQQEFVLKLSGLNCPGINQPGGKAARDLVTKATLGKTLKVEILGTGTNEELIGLLFDSEGKCLNEELVKKGFGI